MNLMFFFMIDVYLGIKESVYFFDLYICIFIFFDVYFGNRIFINFFIKFRDFCNVYEV